MIALDRQRSEREQHQSGRDFQSTKGFMSQIDNRRDMRVFLSNRYSPSPVN
jgi:hypothetical protein